MHLNTMVIGVSNDDFLIITKAETMRGVELALAGAQLPILVSHRHGCCVGGGLTWQGIRVHPINCGDGVDCEAGARGRRPSHAPVHHTAPIQGAHLRRQIRNPIQI